MIAPVDVTCPICLAPPGNTCVTFPDGITRGIHEARETRALYARIEALEAEVARYDAGLDNRRCELARAHDGPHRYAATPIAAGDEVDIIDGLSRGHRGTVLAFARTGETGVRLFKVDVRGVRTREIREDFMRRRATSTGRCTAVLALEIELTCSLAAGHDGDHEHVVDGHTTTWTGHRSGCDCEPCESYDQGRKAGLEEARLAVAGRLHLFSWGDRPIVEGCVAAIDKLRGAS